MPVPGPFPPWLARVRAGDPAAAAELVAAFGPAVRRIVWARIVRTRLARVVDPQDVYQSVLGAFFARVASDWAEIASADQLAALLATIARNKTRDEVRRHTATRRDHRRAAADRSSRLDRLAAPDPTPSRVVAWRDLYESALCHLTPDERELLEDRLAGRSWAAIAGDRGTPEAALRQKLHRAVHRVRRRLTAELAAVPDGPGL
jgi:RNA polymerase sigma factor (sigma-70 family)